MSSKVVLGLVGSPNRDARTYQLVQAALAGAEEAGARTELVQMADHVVDACKDCLPWVCRDNLKCTYDDPAFELLSEKVLSCGALVLGTPIYWWDTSGMVRYLMLKMFRVYARQAPLNGLPAFGIGVAGGTGNGLVSGLRPVYHFFQMMRMRVLGPVPATRFNFAEAQEAIKARGVELGRMAEERRPFATDEERFLWYDELPYLGLSRQEERRLLAGMTTAAAGEDSGPRLAQQLVHADALALAGDQPAALAQIGRTYDAGVKAFESR
ncbi:MAG: NAD(P)H-dependent oxidoreductase [Chloroflexi bacterium]|nr:NAD(P)H-dependent oxidoreductase [Chloroflexota bacterium]